MKSIINLVYTKIAYFIKTDREKFDQIIMNETDFLISDISRKYA